MKYFRRVYDLVNRIIKVRGTGGTPCIMDSITHEQKLGWSPISLNAPNDVTCNCCILDTSGHISTGHWTLGNLDPRRDYGR